MSQEVSAGILGMSLLGDQLRIVEGRKESGELRITRIAHGRVRQSFNFEAFSDNNTARRFAEDINRLYKTQDFQEKQAAFSLDSAMVLIKKVPIDKELADSKIEEQIKWEVDQFAISPINEYIIDFEEILSTSTNGSAKDMLVVAVRKRIVEYLRQIFSHTDLQLKVVDVDLFSAQRALQLNYEVSSSDKIGLIDIQEDRAYFSILTGRNYYLSQEVIFPTTDPESENKEDSTARIISKELKRIIMDEQLGKGIDDLNQIYLYGEAVEDGILEGLQGNNEVNVDRANPFKEVKLVSEIEEKINETSDRDFIAACDAICWLRCRGSGYDECSNVCCRYR